MPSIARKSTGRGPLSGGASSRSKTKTRARDLPIPKSIGDSDFEEICRPYGISDSDRRQLLIEINTILKNIAAWMRKQRREPRRDQIRRLTSAAKAIRKARDLLDDYSDQLFLSFTAESLAPMVSAVWLRQQFPDDPSTPTSQLPGFVDDDASLLQRKHFIEHRGPEVIKAILRTVEAGFAETVTAKKYVDSARVHDKLKSVGIAPLTKSSGGGPEPLAARLIFIMMLANKWEHLGKEALTSPKSDFVSFVDNIMAAIGWPSDVNSENGGAVLAAISDALGYRRNPARKKPG